MHSRSRHGPGLQCRLHNPAQSARSGQSNRAGQPLRQHADCQPRGTGHHPGAAWPGAGRRRCGDHWRIPRPPGLAPAAVPVQQQLHSRNPRQVLTLEQFNLDHQAALDAYLAGESGEQELIEDANAWDNYQASYRPLVELARDHSLPVIAANAPADTVRCVGQVGPAYLAQLPEAERQALPAEPFLDTPAYREKFNNAISRSHGQGDPGTAERMEKIYQAQLLRDNTMATQILNARERFPGYQILHLTGNFHSEQGLGTVALLKQRAPELSIQVLSPVFWLRAQTEAPLADNLDKGDYLYLIRPLPPEYRNEDRQRKAMQERFSKRPDVRCEAD